jgi:hypothetical protein
MNERSSSLRVALVGCTAAAMLCGSLVTTATAVWRYDRPERVLRLDGNNGPALAALAQFRLADGGLERPQVQREIEMLARRAIADTPLNPTAMTALATARAAQKGPSASYPLFRASDRQSRRNAGTQMWLIEYEASADRADRALRHYDVMLRVQPETGEVLFPIMGSAVSDQRLWSAFAPYFRAPPPWFADFFRKAVITPGSAAPLAMISGGSGRLPDTPLMRGLQTQLLGQLVAEGNFTEAVWFAGKLRDGGRHRLDTVALDTAGVDQNWVPFAWQAPSTTTISTSFEPRDGGRYRIRTTAGAGSAGLAARRVVMLSPGRYALRANGKQLAASPADLADFSIRCLRSNQILGGLRVLGRRATTDGDGSFTIPPGCLAQELLLVIETDRTSDGLDLAVEDVAVSRSTERSLVPVASAAR